MKEESLQLMMDMPTMHRLMHDHSYDWDSSMNDIGVRGGVINAEKTKITHMEEMQQRLESVETLLEKLVELQQGH